MYEDLEVDLKGYRKQAGSDPITKFLLGDPTINIQVDGDGNYVGRKPQGKSSLPSLRRGDDIPAALYPAGVSTGVGGGNAGQAQGTNKDAPAYIAPKPKPAAPPAPAPAPTSRGDKSDPAPDGSGAKGTYTGYRSPQLSEVPGMADINQFLSTQLPESAGEKNQDLPSTPPKGARLTDEDGAEYYGPAFGNPNDAEVVEGISTPGKSGASSVETADNNRAVSVPGERLTTDELNEMFKDGPVDPAAYATNYDARRTAQRNAFLSDDYDKSLDAIRASNQAIGVDQLGHKYYMRDGEELVEMTKEAYDKHRSTGLSAEEFKNARVQKVKETLVPAETTDVTDTSGGSTPDSDFSSTDYQVMGGSQKDSETIAGGGAVETTITPEGMKTNYFSKDQEWEFGSNNSMPGS